MRRFAIRPVKFNRMWGAEFRIDTEDGKGFMGGTTMPVHRSGPVATQAVRDIILEACRTAPVPETAIEVSWHEMQRPPARD